MQNSKRSKELNQFCPPNSRDDHLPSVLSLSLFSGACLPVSAGRTEVAASRRKETLRDKETVVAVVGNPKTIQGVLCGFAYVVIDPEPGCALRSI